MSIEFRSVVVGPFSTNCYVLWDRSSRRSAIIDPGGDSPRIAALVSSLGLKPELILITHGHPDHCFDASHLAEAYGAEIAMHALDVEALEDNLPLAETFFDMSAYVPFSASRLLSDGDVMALGDSSIEVMHTPGHSPGGVCYATDAGIFCGDTVFAGSVGRTDFPGGSYDALMLSIHERILPLDDATPLHPGHGPSTTVGIERRTNPLMR